MSSTAVLADLIVHVVDASAPEAERGETMTAVDAVLAEIGADEAARLVVLNKVDLLDDEERRDLAISNPGAIPISAADGSGLDELRDAIADAFAESLEPLEVLVPYDAGERLSELHEVAGAVEREDRPEGVLVKAKVPAALAHRFEDLDVNGSKP